ncbi:hypothetical protein JCM8547_006174 [Rhodosporidiobolus lusitaniae]
MPPRWVFTVNATLSTLSVCGGLGIAVGYALSAQRRALRQKLVLGLGLTDLLQGAVTLGGNALELQGHKFIQNSSGCLASGFLYQTCVICGAAWTLSIALTTYITLVHPFSSATAALEHRFAFPVIALVVLLIGIAPSIPVTIVYDLVDFGGICWLPSGTIEGNLMLFVPRAFTLVLVILLYLRLFIFFRTRDLEHLDTTTEYGEDEEDVRRGSKRLSMASLGGRLSDWKFGGRRSSEASRQSLTPPGILSPAVPTSAPLSPIPGSPNIAFTTPFSPPSGSTGSAASHAVAISFPPSRESPRASPTQSVQSTFSPPPPVHKANFPHRVSLTGVDPPVHEPSVRRKRPLSPRQVNRRLSLLMAAYPLAYACLVSVAVARLIQSFSRGNQPAEEGLRYGSAFLIYSQGAIDGLLFVVVSVAFKRWTSKGR